MNRSRSSSTSSQDNPVTKEGVTLLAFIEAFLEKKDPTDSPSLWVGTSLGSCLVISLSVPVPGVGSRLEDAVFAAPSGLQLRSKAKILTLGFMDSNFALLVPPAESWKEANKETDRPPKNRVITRSRVSPTQSLEGGPGTGGSGDQEYAVVVWERRARVLALPSQNCVFSTKFETPLLRASVENLQGVPIMAACTVNGRIVVLSLPSLRTLLDCPFLPQNDQLAGRTLCFSHHAHGMYMCSPSEIQKFTVSSDIASQLSEVVGELFQGIQMPEAPKKGFLHGLFGPSTQTVDREELCKNYGELGVSAGNMH